MTASLILVLNSLAMELYCFSATVKILQSFCNYRTHLHGIYHRLNGNSSPVLAATFLSYREAKNLTPHRIKTPEPIEIKFDTVDYVSNGTHHAKFYANSSKGASR